jgi:hypothetical protein
LLQSAQLDPKDEQIRLFEQRELWQQEQQALAKQHQEQVAALERQRQEAEFHQAVQERKREILSDINSAAREYYDEDSKTYLVSPMQIAAAIEATGLSPTEAARHLADAILTVASKRIQRPVAPTTAVSNSSGARMPAVPPKWTGDTLKDDIFEDIMAARAKRRGM